MDPNAQQNLDHWTHLHTIYPNDICPSNCHCMANGWDIMCENLEFEIEQFHEKINEWNAIESTILPLLPSKTHMMNVAARSYWNYREERENSNTSIHGYIFRNDHPLPPCVHNKISENIDLILKDLQEVLDEVELTI
jgi:hypothetical protein